MTFCGRWEEEGKFRVQPVWKDTACCLPRRGRGRFPHGNLPRRGFLLGQSGVVFKVVPKSLQSLFLCAFGRPACRTTGPGGRPRATSRQAGGRSMLSWESGIVLTKSRASATGRPVRCRRGPGGRLTGTLALFIFNLGCLVTLSRIPVLTRPFPFHDGQSLNQHFGQVPSTAQVAGWLAFVRLCEYPFPTLCIRCRFSGGWRRLKHGGNIHLSGMTSAEPQILPCFHVPSSQRQVLPTRGCFALRPSPS